MKMTRWMHVAVGLPAIMLLAALTTANPVAAQDERSSCRCVDASGNEIENCSCLRTMLEDGFPRVLAFGPNRARLGVSVNVEQGATVDVEGALVTEVLDDGPADRAGIREGDIITRVGDQSLVEPSDTRAERDFDLDRSIPVQRLLALVEELEPGREIEVEYLRDGALRTTTLETRELGGLRGGMGALALPRFDDAIMRDRLRDLAAEGWGGRVAPRVWSDDDLPDPDRGGDVRFRLDRGRDGSIAFFDRGGGVNVFRGSNRTGVDLVELKPALGAYFGVDEGVLVTDVARSSDLGLEPGDVVLAVEDRPVTTPQLFQRLLSRYGPDEDVTFRIMRKGEETTVTGRVRD